MPYIPDDQFKVLIKKITELEVWKKDTERKISFLNTIQIEGKGRITMSGGHLKVNSNLDTTTVTNHISGV